MNNPGLDNRDSPGALLAHESEAVQFGVYIHWPFCLSKCPYCDFNSHVRRAEIDEAEWSKLYSATSQPFDPPKSGKIAVKVINHFGDEVMKVFRVAP